MRPKDNPKLSCWALHPLTSVLIRDRGDIQAKGEEPWDQHRRVKRLQPVEGEEGACLVHLDMGQLPAAALPSPISAEGRMEGL